MSKTGRGALHAVDVIGSWEALDPVVDRVGAAAAVLLRSPDGRSATEGTRQRWSGLWRGEWLGHSLHPLLSDFVEGPWMAASFLDLIGPPGSAGAARRLLGFGLAVAIPCWLAGLADWRQAGEQGDRRVGALHFAASSASVGLYGASYLARLRGRHGPGVALGVAGGVIATVDGYLAGHLSHVRGVAVGAQADVPRS